MTLRKLLVRAGWALIITLSAYYLYRAILYRYITPDQLGPSLFNKKLFYFGHLIAALPVLLGALLQFYTKLRYKWPLCRTPALYDSQLSICAHPGLAAHNRRHPGRLHIFDIRDQAIRDTTQEWMSWVIPLLVVEFSISWLPMLRSKKQV